MMIDNKKGWYQRLRSSAIERMVPASAIEENGLIYWRARILFSLCFFAAIFALTAMVPVAIIVVKNNAWGLGLFDALSWLFAIILLFYRGISFKIRSAIALLFVYFLGLVIIIHVGILSGGPICLFGFAVLAGIFKETKTIAVALILNAVTLIIIGWLMGTGRFGGTFPFFKSIEAMLAAGSTFMLINAGVAISVRVLVKGLETANQKQKELVEKLENEQGRLEKTRMTLEREVNGHIEAEKALKESEERYRDLVESASDLIVSHDIQGKILSVNEAAARAGGYSAKENPEIRIPDIISPDWRDKFDDYIETLNREGSVSGIMQVLTRSGEKLFWEYRSTLSTEGVRGPVVRAIARDVTQQVAIKKALEESEARWKFALEGSKDGIWDWNAVTDRVYYSDQWKAMLGYDANEIGDTINEWESRIHPDDKAQAYADLERHFRRETETYQNEHRLLCKDGSYKWVFDRGKVFEWSEDGKPLRVIGTHTDITDRKRAEEEKAFLETRYRQLQKSESLGRMAGAIAHHFNNQLAVVIGNIELASEKLSDGKHTAGYLSEAKQSAVKASKMSGLMLTYLGQVPIKRKPVDLSESLRQGLPSIRETMPKDILFNIALPSDGPVINADANQLYQVISNLVTNAWESIGAGRKIVDLNVKTIFTREILKMQSFPVEWKPLENAYACIEVADTGCGIAGNDIEKIFDPFFSSKFTGRGLGLAVVLGIMKSHGGAVNVESEPGKGSIFRVFFPLSPEKPIEAEKKPDTLPTPDGGFKVLLVEDDNAVRKMAKSMLALLGYIVIEAKDGVEAVEMFRQRGDEIKCVLCDLTMPRMDGWKTMTALRQIDPDIPVILASGYDRDKVMEGRDTGRPQVFLNKPYDLKGVGDAIRRAVAGLGTEKRI